MGRVAVGYHGTIAAMATEIMRNGFRPNPDPGDWLGTGIYFWQDAPYRAVDWASGRKTYKKRSGPIVLIKADLDLDGCLDLLDSDWMSAMQELVPEFAASLSRKGMVLRNEPGTGLHQLDCAFFNYFFDMNRKNGRPFRSVRAACTSGRPLFEDSPIYTAAHVQINVLDHTIIQNREVIGELPEPGTTWKRGYQ